MSNPANPQHPYSPPTQPGAPAGYPQQAHQRAPLDRGALSQVLFGGVLIVGIAVLSNLMQIIGSALYSFGAESILSLFWSLFLAVVFVAGAGASALYIAPIAKATSTVDLLKKLAIAAAVGTAALLVFNFIWSVLNGGQYLVETIISSGLLGSISTGAHYGAFFALGVLVARALPPRTPGFIGQPQAYAGQPQAPSAPHGYVQPGPGAPQGYVQPGAAAPQGYVQPGAAAPQGYVQQPGSGALHGSAAPQGYGQPQAYSGQPQPQGPDADQGQPPTQQQPPFAPQA
jgi:hypothetical protein